MQRLCKSNAMKLAPIAEMPPILSKDTLFPSHRQTSYMILTQTIRKLIYLFALIPNIIIKSPLYCSYICQKIRFLIENTKKIVENLQAISKLLNAPATFSLQSHPLYPLVLASHPLRSHPAQPPGEGSDAPPTL